MSFLVVKLTPPKKGCAAADMSPASYLVSEQAISPLKRKAHFRQISSGTAKKLRLDPIAHKDDLTITMYHERTKALMPEDRQQIHIHIPFQDEIERCQHKIQVCHKIVNFFSSNMLISTSGTGKTT
jgi:hypothetical protein